MSRPNRLKEFRKAKKLRQTDVAKYLGFKSTDRISRWEKGTMYPHVLNFLKLIELYEVEAGEVYGLGD